jgi:hypothetical protein
VRKAILFGSLASGNVGPASDLDLIIVVPSTERFTRRLERFYQVLNPSVVLDLFVCTPEELAEMSEGNPFVRSAIAGGQVVYEGSGPAPPTATSSTCRAPARSARGRPPSTSASWSSPARHIDPDPANRQRAAGDRVATPGKAPVDRFFA